MKNYPVVLITGARQVGKSFMLKNEFPNIKKVSMADPVVRKQATEDPQLFLKTMGIPLIIDEVQLTPDLFSQLLFVVDKNGTNGQYILTGSKKYELLKGITESLAGRVAIIEMNTLSLREVNNIDFNRSFIPEKDYFNLREKYIVEYNNVYDFIFRSGYSKIYHNNIENIEQYYSDYVKTYLEKYIKGLIQPQNEIKFFNFLIAIAVRSGQN